MGIYIALVFGVLIFSGFMQLINLEKEKRETIIAIVGIIAIFLICILRHESVGSDTIGYKEQYEIAKFQKWGDWGYVYFESGYIALMMLFAKAGIEFRFFVIFLYTIFCSAILILIKKYSKNATMSLLMFICYQTFVFSLSGFRQTLAMAMCIYAYLIGQTRKKYTLFISILLVCVAISFHQSAVVFFAVILVIRTSNRKINIFGWIMVCVCSVVFRTFVWRFVEVLYAKSMSQMDLGGNMIFLLGIAVFMIYTYYNEYYLEENNNSTNIDTIHLKIMLLSVICYFMFCGSTMLRANMYFKMFMIVSVPVFISKYKHSSRIIINVLLGIFLIVLFYMDTLAPNQLDICPYRFFWQ